jgi:hypothetical protein
LEKQNAAALFTMLKYTVETNGCKIVDVDFDTHRIDIDGPEEKLADCAEAIERLLN